jgi:hypothetical protein|tara:strand:- start:1520 stop:2248 length:729 start_codon:yes stop_codon:yes gene_type:complete
VLTLLAACASAPAPQPGILTDIDPIEQVAIDALKLNLAEEARTGLDAALVKYQMLDDLEGQWRIHLINTKLANGNGDHTAANAEVDRLDELAKLINTDFVHYHTDILLGQIKQETRHFQSALGVAATPLQQAVALTYLDRVDEAVAMIDSSEVDHPTDRAFILFRYALSTGDEADLQRALAVYKLAEDSRGVADTLVLLSRRSRQNNDLRSAQIYGRRAIRVLSSMGDLRRADIIEAWLAEL